MRRFVFLAFVVMAAMLMAALPVAAQDSTPATPKGNYAGLSQGTIEGGFPIIGDPEAKIALVEFSNFSCPGCAIYHRDVKVMIDKFVRTGQARFIFFPLIFGNDPSLVAAQGALCAHRQAAFWDVHDALFEIHQTRGANSFTVEIIREAVDKLGFDGAAVAQCITAGETIETVRNSINRSTATGVRYTPTLMYSLDGGVTLQWFEGPDGQRFQSSVPIENVEQVVNQALAGTLRQVTPTPSPVPVDPFANLEYENWKSPDNLIEFDHPTAWRASADEQTGPVTYLVAPPAEEGFIFIQGVPIALLRGSQGAPPDATPLDHMKRLFPNEPAERFRDVEVAGFKGAALKQTLERTDQLTGQPVSVDRDLMMLSLDPAHVVIIQAQSGTANWPKMQPIVERFLNSLKIDAVAMAAALQRAYAAQIPPTVTPGPSPTPIDPFAGLAFTLWKSPNGLIELEIPSAWSAQPALDGPVSYVFSWPDLEEVGLVILALPLERLGFPQAPPDATLEDYMKLVFPDQPAENIRSVQAGGFVGVGLKQTLTQTDPNTGQALSRDLDLWFLSLDPTHVLIIQAFSTPADWPKMQQVLTRAVETLKLDGPGAIQALKAAFAPPATGTPIARAEGFTPLSLNEGACVGVKDPEKSEVPGDSDRKQWDAPAQVIDPTHRYCAILVTEKGRIIIELYPQIAPQHVNSFVFLAQQGFYDDITWHRVIKGFVAQSGDPTGTGTGGPGYTIPLEVNAAASYDRVGVLGMARTADPNSAGSQFFITFGPQPGLDPGPNGPGYTIFGQVVEGMGVVEQIAERDPAQGATAPGDKLISVRIVDLGPLSR